MPRIYIPSSEGGQALVKIKEGEPPPAQWPESLSSKHIEAHSVDVRTAGKAKPAPQSRLLALPAELRNEVMKEVQHLGNEDRTSDRDVLAVTAACRQLMADYRPQRLAAMEREHQASFERHHHEWNREWVTGLAQSVRDSVGDSQGSIDQGHSRPERRFFLQFGHRPGEGNFGSVTNAGMSPFAALGRPTAGRAPSNPPAVDLSDLTEPLD